MRVKQRSVCQNCRSRKLGCDGKSPECSQCLLTGRQCPGYPVNWSFVQSQSKPAQSRRSPSNISNRDHSPRDTAEHESSLSNIAFRSVEETHLLPTLGAGYNLHRAEQVDFIIRSYVPNEELELPGIISNEPRPRICGSWVEVLPSLSENSDSNIIMAASKALSTSLMSRGFPERVSSVDTTHNYLNALKLMRKELSTANMSSDRELLASIMCLSLAEVMFPGPSEGLKMHIDAVAQILQANGPQRYQTGVAHRLFIGFRPLLMINAIQCRTPSFLGSDTWKTTPFAILSPSPMQSLLGQAAALPTILHTLDNLSGPDASDKSQYECERILNCFNDLLHGLNNWETSESINVTSPLYWYRDQDPEEIPCIWFPSITMANVITYIWAFRIICLCEMERLASSLPQPSTEYLRILKEQHIESVQKSSETLMRRICESMEYLLQEEMKLFGPASTILPLQVAYAVATMNGNQHNGQLPILKRIVERLVLKGLQSFPMLIFERNSFLHRWDRLSNRQLA